MPLDFIYAPWNRYLINMLERYTPLPDSDKVVKLLRFGASPWAQTKSGRSVFSLLTSRAPDSNCVDAWFDAAGDLSKAPWTKYGTPSPLRDLLYEENQSEGVRKQWMLRMIEGNVNVADVDLPGNSLIERIWWLMPNTRVEIITKFVEKNPSLIANPAAKAFLFERSREDLHDLGLVATSSEANLIEEHTMPASRTTRRPRNRL